MTTTTENNIRALEMLAEELRQDLNAAISEYEDALEYPGYYDVEAAKMAMDDAQRYYDECLDEIDTERMWAAF